MSNKGKVMVGEVWWVKIYGHPSPSCVARTVVRTTPNLVFLADPKDRVRGEPYKMDNATVYLWSDVQFVEGVN